MAKAPNIARAIEVAIDSNLMPITLLFNSGYINLELMLTRQLSLLALVTINSNKMRTDISVALAWRKEMFSAIAIYPPRIWRSFSH